MFWQIVYFITLLINLLSIGKQGVPMYNRYLPNNFTKKVEIFEALFLENENKTGIGSSRYKADDIFDSLPPIKPHSPFFYLVVFRSIL